jgi:hypothetical protein
MTKISTSTIGTDPEFFLKRKSDGKLISAIPFIDGTKDLPTQLKCGGNMQRDNVAVEFATAPVAGKDEFIAAIKNTMTEVVNRLPEEYEIVALPSADFPDDELRDPEALRFGCTPDFCAWNISQNDPPIGPRYTFRSCGGHIHVGYVKDSGNDFLLTFDGKITTVRSMDLFHGIISVILDNSPASIERRMLYGKAGCHRPTKYGIEYRTLSNYWIKSPMLVALMWSLKEDVLQTIRDNNNEKMIKVVGAEEIQDIINNGKTTEASNVVDSVLKEHMSAESKELFDMCSDNIGNNTSLMESWEIRR